jgi:hypothetical protein
MAGKENELLWAIRKIDTVVELKTVLEELERVVYYMAEEDNSAFTGEDFKLVSTPHVAVFSEALSDHLTALNRALNKA